jgi:hypothetical protein
MKVKRMIAVTVGIIASFGGPAACCHFGCGMNNADIVRDPRSTSYPLQKYSFPIIPLDIPSKELQVTCC